MLLLIIVLLLKFAASSLPGGLKLRGHEKVVLDSPDIEAWRIGNLAAVTTVLLDEVVGIFNLI